MRTGGGREEQEEEEERKGGQEQGQTDASVFDFSSDEARPRRGEIANESMDE